MADDYGRESDRFQRELKFQSDLAALGELGAHHPNKVLEMLRSMYKPEKPRLYEYTWESNGGVKVTVRTSDFRDAPRGLSDPELAEWAVRKFLKRKAEKP